MGFADGERAAATAESAPRTPTISIESFDLYTKVRDEETVHSSSGATGKNKRLLYGLGHLGGSLLTRGAAVICHAHCSLPHSCPDKLDPRGVRDVEVSSPGQAGAYERGPNHRRKATD